MSKNRYLILLNRNDDIEAVADCGCQSAERLMFRLFNLYAKVRYVRLDSVITDIDMLFSPDFYHFGKISGSLNVFACNKKLFQRLKAVPLKSYGLVPVPNSSIYADVLLSRSSGLAYYQVSGCSYSEIPFK